MSTSGQQVFTGADVKAGQDVFLRNGLMEFGSIFGHGLRRLGRMGTSPFDSRVLAGHRRATGTAPPVLTADWPHSEVPRLYAALAGQNSLASVSWSASYWPTTP